MKTRLSALLALLLALLLFGCAADSAAPSDPYAGAASTESAARPSTGPTASSAPSSAAPGPAQTSPAPAQTPEPGDPKPVGSVADYASLRASYEALIRDPEARDRAIGHDGDYRRTYFGWDSALPEISAYALADLNGDDVPELLLTDAGTGMTDVFCYDGALRYLGYDCVLGFLPEGGARIVRGHWHGSGGSGEHEYSAQPLFDAEAPSVYFDYMEYEGQRAYSFLEGDAWYAGQMRPVGANPEDERRYEELYQRYVLSCVRLADIPFFAPANPDGLNTFSALADMPRLRKAAALAPEYCAEFLQGQGWNGQGLALEGKTPGALVFDLDSDGVAELLLSDGESGAVFRYNAVVNQMVYLGPGPADAWVFGAELYGRTGDAWTAYRLSANFLRTTPDDGTLSELLARDAVRLSWTEPDELAAALLK